MGSRYTLICSVAGAAIVAMALTARSVIAQPGGRPLTAEDQVRAAVLRHLSGGPLREPVAAICLGDGPSTAAQDPSPALLRSLAAHRPAVLPWSACEMSLGGDTVRATGEAAFMVGVQRAAFVGDRATVAASHHRHGRHAGSYACQLDRVEGAWIVERCTLTRRA